MRSHFNISVKVKREPRIFKSHQRRAIPVFGERSQVWLLVYGALQLIIKEKGEKICPIISDKCLNILTISVLKQLFFIATFTCGLV